MLKNVASQVMGATLVNASTGAALTTGTVTIYLTLDNGTQAAGSVSSGACTHKGNGLWNYAPTQAETNANLIQATFVHSSGVNVTKDYYTQVDVSYLAGQNLLTARRIPQLGIIEQGTASAFSGANITFQTGHGYSDNTINGSAVYFKGTSAGTEYQVGYISSSSGDVFTLFAAPQETPTGTITYFVIGLPTNTTLSGIKTVTDKLNTALELDGSVYRFTQNALEQGPSAADPQQWLTGTATGGGTNTLISAAGLPATTANKYVGAELVLTSGSGVDESFRVTAYDTSTHQITFVPSLSNGASVQNGDTFKLRRSAVVTLAGIEHANAKIAGIAGTVTTLDQVYARLPALQGGLVPVVVKGTKDHLIAGSGTVLDPWGPGSLIS